MRKTWISAAAAAGLSTVAAAGLAIAQERHPGQDQATSGQQMEKGQIHRGEATGRGAQSAQAQSPAEERQRSERMGQEKMGQEPGKATGEQGKAAQGAQRTGEQPANQAQTEKMKGEQRAGQENRTNQGAQMNRENGAAANQQPGQANQPRMTEKGKAAERTGQKPGTASQKRGAAEATGTAAETQKGKPAEGQAPANENRAGQAQTGGAEMRNNRQGEGQNAPNGQNARAETHVNPQNVHVEGNTHLSNDRAARVADTLLATATPQNVNVNVRVGEPLPGDVRLLPLPPTIVDLVPEYRDYDYVVVNDEIVIVQPSTRHVVEVINTGGGEEHAMAATHVNPCGP